MQGSVAVEGSSWRDGSLEWKQAGWGDMLMKVGRAQDLQWLECSSRTE